MHEFDVVADAVQLATDVVNVALHLLRPERRFLLGTRLDGETVGLRHVVQKALVVDEFRALVRGNSAAVAKTNTVAAAHEKALAKDGAATGTAAAGDVSREHDGWKASTTMRLVGLQVCLRRDGETAVNSDTAAHGKSRDGATTGTDAAGDDAREDGA